MGHIYWRTFFSHQLCVRVVCCCCCWVHHVILYIRAFLHESVSFDRLYIKRTNMVKFLQGPFLFLLFVSSWWCQTYICHWCFFAKYHLFTNVNQSTSHHSLLAQFKMAAICKGKHVKMWRHDSRPSTQSISIFLLFLWSACVVKNIQISSSSYT
jgi:hypothetical protein